MLERGDWSTLGGKLPKAARTPNKKKAADGKTKIIRKFEVLSRAL